MSTLIDAASIDLAYRLEDAIVKPEGRVFTTGTQALVRMLVLQRLVDRRDGIRTAGFVSGYRGSPLAGVDTELWRSAAALAAHDIRFMPGVNEDLAATAVAGTQRVETDPLRAVDGVFAMWYGKGPGVDRAGDAIHHGHAAGASGKGGVLLVVGDDHAATSSSIPNASDLSLIGWNLPIIHPANVDDYVDYGLWGWAASRFSGAWIAFKAISETVESSQSFVAPVLPRFIRPEWPAGIPNDLGYSTKDFLTAAIEQRMAWRLAALTAFARANPIDRMLVDAPEAEIGIIAVGKSGRDALEAFARVGLLPDDLARRGVRIWQPGLVYPIDPEAVRRFGEGLKHLLVIEEKASVVEAQVKEIAFNWLADRRPTIVGKNGLDGAPLISPLAQHRPSSLAAPLARWVKAVRPDLAFDDRLQVFVRAEMLSNNADGARRLPYFCSGCPHNSSTKVPEGSRALAGVGCHYMASWMDRSTSGLTQMGGEGVDWVGQAPFSAERHVFQNMGEGTYYHSGYLAIRQAVAARVNVTYKLLFNDAVAMTGGQPVDGPISVPQIVQQMLSEGARKVAVVTDEPERYSGVSLPAGVDVSHRRNLDMIQRELRAIEGVTVLVYDQTCAAEKRRRRKKGKFPDPDRRILINPDVCEGCGDCGRASNCLSVVPLETELGRKRAIDQTSCNKDFSCVEGFCPSFVSVIGGKLRKAPAMARDWAAEAQALPAPRAAKLGTRPHNLLIAGVGGTGIITVGAVVAMAAHLDGIAISELDFTALAQKGGSVMCHLRMAAPGTRINQSRIDWREADGVIIGDLIVGCLPDSLGTVGKERTRVIVNTHIGATAEFVRNPDADPHAADLLAKVRHTARLDAVATIDAQAAAQQSFGDATSANMILVGLAWQQGLIPVSEAALIRAIELNGVAVEINKRAFSRGRLLAMEKADVPANRSSELIKALPELVDDRVRRLTDYQSAALAASYRNFIDATALAEQRALGAGAELIFTRQVARALYRLMAYKDEYEVARLYTSPEFKAMVARQFEGDVALHVHLAPPLLARKRPGTNIPQKMTFGPWMFRMFRVLARMKTLRGTWFDPFGYTAERRMELALIDEYRSMIERVRGMLSPRTLSVAVQLAASQDDVRGYGHVKHGNVDRVRREQAELLDALDRLVHDKTSGLEVA